MELTPTRKKLLFAGLIVVFVIIGLVITWPHGGTDPNAAPSASPTASATKPRPAPTASIDPADFDIYKLLPFDKQECVAAATTAQSFTAAYGTYRYDETPQEYTNRLKSLSAGEFAKTLKGAGGGGMGGEDVKTNQVVSRGSATLAGIRSFDAQSIIFIVNAHQDIASKTGDDTKDAKFAVTVTGSGSDWQVYDFQPASAGNAGDVG